MCDPFSDRPDPATRRGEGMRARLARFGRAVKRQINADAARIEDLRVAEQIRPADFLTGNTMIVRSAGAGGDDCLARCWALIRRRERDLYCLTRCSIGNRGPTSGL
ncbi:hypothetical protein A9R05_44215 (plasmid) [Burkholderia sp. KK1]|nr:hypothetical protein A9R05_44215 [Burkholderia sp. KK1]